MVGIILNPEAASFAIAPLSDAHDAEHAAFYVETETKADLFTALLAILRIENEKSADREPVENFLVRLEEERVNISILHITVDDVRVSSSLKPVE
jgi:hypothetical protein